MASERFLKGRPGKLLSLEDADVVLFEESDGAVITAHDPHAAKGAAVQFSASTVAIVGVDGGLEELQRYLDLKAAGVVIKIIGSSKLIVALQSALTLLGVSASVRHELSGGPHEIYFYPASGRARVSKGQKSGGERKIKVLVVDDSKTIRNLITNILSSDPLIEVVATADGPELVEGLIAKHHPDVITLDIHMPGMDGVTLLKKYLPKFPIPTVMISSISMEEGPLVLSALEFGAVEYIQKPSFEQLKTVAPMIIEKIKVAAAAKVTVGANSLKSLRSATTQSTVALDQSAVIAIGSSTGGTEALRVLMSGLPDHIPPIVVVQHIPAVFSKAFAMRMNELFAFEVKEAEDGDLLMPDRILIAPGGFQMSVKRSKGDGSIRAIIQDAPPVNRHKPSVDFLFDSVVAELGKQATGVILTGMGGDGAKGMLKMREAGCETIAQDEASCVVFGMPREAIRLGAAKTVAPLDQIAGQLIRLLDVRSTLRIRK